VTGLEGTHRSTAAENQMSARGHPAMLPHARAGGAGPRGPAPRRVARDDVRWRSPSTAIR